MWRCVVHVWQLCSTQAMFALQIANDDCTCDHKPSELYWKCRMVLLIVPWSICVDSRDAVCLPSPQFWSSVAAHWQNGCQAAHHHQKLHCGRSALFALLPPPVPAPSSPRSSLSSPLTLFFFTLIFWSLGFNLSSLHSKTACWFQGNTGQEAAVPSRFPFFSALLVSSLWLPFFLPSLESALQIIEYTDAWLCFFWVVVSSTTSIACWIQVCSCVAAGHSVLDCILAMICKYAYCWPRHKFGRRAVCVNARRSHQAWSNSVSGKSVFDYL